MSRIADPFIPAAMRDAVRSGKEPGFSNHERTSMDTITPSEGPTLSNQEGSSPPPISIPVHSTDRFTCGCLPSGLPDLNPFLEERVLADDRTRETWLDLIMNVAAPATILLTLTSEDRLGPIWGLVVALAFPIAHSARSVWRAEKPSPFSWLALVSVTLTGGIGLMELDAGWLAIKEAALPAGLGVLALVSSSRGGPGIEFLLGRLLDADAMNQALAERGTTQEWAASAAQATRRTGYVLFASAIANFALARNLVVSEGGSQAFAEELGRFTALSFPVIGLPTTLLMGWVLRDLLLAMEKHTDQPVDAWMS